MAQWVFWISVAIVFYTYVGYPVLLWLRVCLRPRRWTTGNASPRLSVVMAVRNEEGNLPCKLSNLTQVDYPADHLDLIVASDGSTDRTNQILSEFGALPMTPVLLTENRGKAVALNAAVARATGEIIVFFDARQQIDINAIHALIAPFADRTVGCVSGELVLETPDGTATDVGLYWRIERLMRSWEAQTSSVPGATGAIYAVRRHLVPHIPDGTLLDDVYVPMCVVKQGYRAIHVRHAIARDRVHPDSGKEFQRKVRTLTGVYQITRLLPWTVTPANPIFFEFVSHKLMRLLAPFALIAALVSSMLTRDSLYYAAFLAQLLFYCTACLGLLHTAHPLGRVVRVASTFVLLNLAAIVAFRNAVFGKRDVWV